MTIRIENPCHEDWNRMQPNGPGRHCGACSKTVVDFTGQTKPEIESYLSAHKGVCGRFRASQLAQGPEVIIRVPIQSIYRMSHQQRLMLAFLFAFSSMFSCTNDQNVVGKIKRVEIVSVDTTSSVEKDSLQLGKSLIPDPLPPKPKEVIELMGEVEAPYPEETLTGISVQIPPEILMGDTIMPAPIMPEYPGGNEAMQNFIKNHLHYPADTLSGRVVAEFIVNTEGKITQPKIIRSLAPAYDAEVLRVISLMPDWKPGTENGSPADMKYMLPVKFENKPVEIIKGKVWMGKPRMELPGQRE